MECRRHAKTREEDKFWSFTSNDQLCSGDEGSARKNNKIKCDGNPIGPGAVPRDSSVGVIFVTLRGKNSRVILVLCDILSREIFGKLNFC